MKHNVHVIAIEGIDGSGKSTLIDLLQQTYPVSLYQRTKKGRVVDKLVCTNFLQKHLMLQIPIYLLLSYKNYLTFLLKKNRNRLIIMDRCFLSNICYFYPSALSNKKLFNLIMKFEIPLSPNSIFVLDVDPEIGRTRDNKKKAFEWLSKTRAAYVASKKSALLSRYNIQIIWDTMSVEEKSRIISKYIEKIKWESH